MQLQASLQSDLVTGKFFPMDLLRLSTVTYQAIASTAAAVLSHLEQF